ncbi:MAG: CBS domain-containing protein [Candidatus Thermoplasmatota archaeon]|nr:CBS domain-containing protein [Candidatus Thermoplasmatota archaeon]
MDVEKSFSKVQRTEPISRVLGYLKGASDVLPMVFDGKKCYGFIDERLFISTKLDTNQQIKGFDVRAKTMDESKSASEIAEEMLRSYCSYAPFGKNEKEKSIEGYIKASTVIRELLKEKSSGKNAELLAKPVIALKKDDTIGKAINFLKNFRAVPIVDEKGMLYGCVEQRGNILDLLADRERPRQGAYVSTKEERVFKKPVVNYSTKFAPKCDVNSAIDENLVGIMDTYGYCFVCRDNKPIGILTPPDILKVLV